jgi:hypothetical protein
MENHQRAMGEYIEMINYLTKVKLIRSLAKIAYPVFFILVTLIAILAVIVWVMKMREFHP